MGGSLTLSGDGGNSGGGDSIWPPAGDANAQRAVTEETVLPKNGAGSRPVAPLVRMSPDAVFHLHVLLSREGFLNSREHGKPVKQQMSLDLDDAT